MEEFVISPQTWMVAALTFAAVMCIGGALIAASGQAQREQLEGRLQGQPPALPGARRRQNATESTLGKLGRAASPKGVSMDLQRKMARAGYYSPAAGPIYIGLKLLLFAAGLFGAIAGVLLLEWPYLTEVCGVIVIVGLSFFLPNLLLSWRESARSEEIRRHLPDALDLLEVCVSGGMGIDQAWNAVESQIRPVCPDLADEIALTNLEIHLGADRSTALRNMADRTGADDLNSLVAVLVQSQRFGTPLTEALRVFTGSMRELRSQRAEENAEKMAVKMIIPMTVLIFPVIFIVAVGPAGIKLMEVFGGG